MLKDGIGDADALLKKTDEAGDVDVDDIVRGACVDQDVDASPRHHTCFVHGVKPIIMRLLSMSSLSDS
jgi:hypothetical protein